MSTLWPLSSTQDEVESVIVDDEATQPQWEGDKGTLSMPLRELIVDLLRKPYISATENRGHWATLAEHENTVRSRLNDLFLELVYDAELGIAIVRNVSVDVKLPKLMRKETLRLVPTMLLVNLRQQHMKAHAAGENAYVTRDEMADILRPYIEIDEVRDDVKVLSRTSSAISSFVDKGILKSVDGEEDRFMITDSIALVLDVDTATAIAAQYAAISSGLTHSDPLTLTEENSEEVSAGE